VHYSNEAKETIIFDTTWRKQVEINENESPVVTPDAILAPAA
jgi:hypothetical protein